MITIFGKPQCQNCEKAKALLELNGIGYDYKTIGVDISKEQLCETLGRQVKSAPQIIVNEGGGFHNYIGGLTDLERWIQQEV